MENQRNESPRSEGGPADPWEPAGAEGASLIPTPPDQRPAKRIGWLDGHLPDIVDPLDPQDPDTAFTETRRLRHDGWNPEKMRRFLERYAECGIFSEACIAVGMSARAAYNLRDRDPLFAAGCEAAAVMARTRLADQAFSRSMNGMVERIYKDGAIVAERHRYDNRLTMATLARLDARIDRAEAAGAPHLRLVARWDEYLDALGQQRPEEAQALLNPPKRTDPAKIAADSELRELHLGPPATRDRHEGVWEDEGGWWTDYPPPEDFDGEEEGEYGDEDYRRTLSPAEQAVIDAEEAEDRAEARALAEAQRDAFFFGSDPDPDDGPDAEADPGDSD